MTLAFRYANNISLAYVASGVLNPLSLLEYMLDRQIMLTLFSLFTCFK